ncbi:MAG: sensor histidine kinase [Lachnospiraceae bacterium]|nr:sensor histidine kinase [Lachnospiraceae bacterium]
MLEERKGGMIKKKSSIKHQLLGVYLVAVFLPVFVIGSYLIVNTRRLILEQDYARIESDNLRVRSIMVDVTTSIENVGNVFLLDQELQNIMNGSFDTPKEAYDVYRYYDSFKKYQDMHTEISRIELYLDTDVEYGNFKQVTDKIREAEWYQKAASTAQPLWMAGEYINSVGVVQTELKYIRKIPIIMTNRFAVLVIAINNNHLKSRINNNNVLYTDISVNQDHVFYSEISERVGMPMVASVDYDQTYYRYSGQTECDGNKVLMEVSTLIPIFSSDQIYIVTTDYDAIPHIQNITYICLSLIALSIIGPFFLILLFTTRFNKRILTLRHTMHKASIGDYKITEHIRGNDELTDAFMDMQKMIESITKMDQEIYSAKIKEEQFNSHQQRIKYEMLASQINPHFLYNTLETIRMKALSVGDREVSHAIKLLGKSMRHVLENSMKMVTLESELEYIKVYLEIQHIRFEDRICYQIEVSEDVDVKEYYILPLLLQPIVENGVSHGLETQTECGILTIRIFKEELYLVISVEDNGKGMSKEEVDCLVERMQKEELSTGKNIGLHNIYQRIKLFYGADYGVMIESEPGRGTKVMVRLPVNKVALIDLNESMYNR